jgi:hypothetical protein
MPYKNLEAKQQWEREHREQRNARRRRGGAGARVSPVVPRLAPDPISTQEPKGDWKIAAGIGACLLAVGFGVLAALGVVVRKGDGQ